jgi:hypothetical protein
METPFAKEHRWHKEQDRLNAAVDRTDSGIPLHALPSLRTAQAPPPCVDQLDRDYLDSLTRDQLTSLARELYSDCNRLRSELHVLMAVDPSYKEP